MRNAAETTHSHTGARVRTSVLPDDDIHDQHVSNQPHHAHYGVESSYNNRYYNRVGVVPHAVHLAPRLREARAVGAFGEVPTHTAVVVQQLDLALVIRLRAVGHALHLSGCARLSPHLGCLSADSGALMPRWVRVRGFAWRSAALELRSSTDRTAGNVKSARVEECGRA